MRFLFLCFLFLSGALSAQDWLPEGTVWSNSLLINGFPDGPNRSQVVGDTIIDDKFCSVLSRSKSTCSLEEKLSYIHKTEDQLYMYDQSSDQFTLLYDFSADIGDTVVIRLWPLLYEDPCYYPEYMDCIDTLIYVVDQISDFVLDTVVWKQFEVRYGYIVDGQVYRMYGDGFIIENIGFLKDFFHGVESGRCDYFMSVGMRCFSHPILGDHEFSQDGCEGVLQSVDDHNANLPLSLQVYPVPSQDVISVRYTHSGWASQKWIVTDQLGRIVRIGSVTAQEWQVDLDGIGPGLYHIRVVSSTSFTESAIIIVN